MMRGWSWVGLAVLVAACTRPNAAYDPADGTATSGSAGQPATSDGADDRPSSTSVLSESASGISESASSTVSVDEETRGMEESSGREPTTTFEPGTSTGSDPQACCDFEVCNDPALLWCVCEAHGFEYCCVEWDPFCASAAASACGSDCADTFPAEPCDIDAIGPGCADPCTMFCVCLQPKHEGCCTEAWGLECVMATELEEVLTCISKCPGG